MKTKKIILFLGLGICLFSIGVFAVDVQTCQDCTGTSNCNQEQADACRSIQEVRFMLPDTWRCDGACIKSDAGGTISTCVPGGGFFSNCNYDGASACSGVVQTRDCGTTQQYPAGSGEYCNGACAGEWTTIYDPGTFNNCT